MSAMALLGAVGIGLTLGLTGAGGSILTLPVLVYIADVPPQQAVGLSLIIVGIAALVGALQRALAHEVHGKAVAMFASAGAVGAVAGSQLTQLLSPQMLMLIFAVLMVVVAVRMLLPTAASEQTTADCKPLRCLSAGAVVGVLTGFLGVGGGFLLVPALLKFAKLPLKTATGTSLAIIACNSAIGFLGHMHDATVPWSMVGIYSAIAAAGVLLGGAIVTKLPERALKKTFALVVLATAAFVMWKTFGGTR